MTFDIKNLRIGVVGLGYVGLPLAIEMAESGLHVIGFDVQESKVRAICEGRSYIMDVPSERVAALVESGRLEATADFSRVSELDTVNVCVPTPLRKTRDPDISYIFVAKCRRVPSGLIESAECR